MKADIQYGKVSHCPRRSRRVYTPAGAAVAGHDPALLSEYAERFAENGIDFSVLRDLTDQDLRELGVLLAIVGRCCAIADLAQALDFSQIHKKQIAHSVLREEVGAL